MLCSALIPSRTVQLLAGPQPWRYAHLYTPDESARAKRRNDPPGDDDAENGEEEDEEEPAQPAPIHAVLMDGATLGLREIRRWL
jgi:hypothetical protein